MEQLLRTGRIFTHAAVQRVPKLFLVIVLKSVEDPPLVQHLNDRIFISHYHTQEDGYSNVEEVPNPERIENSPESSIIYRAESSASKLGHSALFSTQDINVLADMSEQVTTTAEVQSYLHNLVVFLRLHRAVVAVEISPIATKYFKQLSRILTVIHGQSFVTPAIIALAFRKIYHHRIRIVTPDFERSIQYGSHLNAVASYLEGVTVDTVIEDVLNELEVPV
ncbi:hypothetical protein ACLMJK_000706 [Lecanora helva]